jgi:membrane fusion protein, multidrug efflux system
VRTGVRVRVGEHGESVDMYYLCVFRNRMTKNKVILWLALILICASIAWKLQANKAEIENLANLSLKTHQYLPVKVAFPQHSTVKGGLTADGIFMPNKEMWLLSETQGHIQQVFKGKGDFVRAGEAIAKVDDELLQIELQTIQINLDKLEKDRQRLVNLIDADAVAKNKIDEVDLGIATARAKIKAIQKQIANTTIKAPMTGTITYRTIETDGVIGLGIQVAQIIDISTLLLTVRVPELDVQKVKKGMTATITPDAYPEKRFQGRVRNVGVKADQAFTYDIELEVKNTPDMAIKAGMHGRAIFAAQGAETGVFIPVEALVGSQMDGKVYVVENDTIAVLKPVQVQKADNGLLKVMSGLQTTDRVVVSGNLTLTDGARVEIVAGND